MAREQLLDLGMSRAGIDRRITRGLLHRRHRGVYVYGREDLSPRGRHRAALMALGPRAVLSHRSAAVHCDLARVRAGPVHVTVWGPQRAGHEGITLHRCAGFDPAETTVYDSLRVTSLPRTLLDIAGSEPQRVLDSALVAAHRERTLDFRAIEAQLERSAGRRGAAVLRSAIASWLEPDDFRSRFERRFHAACRAHGLPTPHFNCSVNGYVVDAHWPRQRVVVELDTYGYHGDPQSFEQDRARDLAHTLNGYTPVRITGKRFETDQAQTMVDLRHLLERNGERSLSLE
ncbi:hypothetical protein BH10ACT11_BH10ACT11_16620 [soil metagenome]